MEGENVKFNDSGITAVISSISLPDKDITDSYTVDYSRKDTILDYTRIVRKPNTKEPVRQLKIIFESASFCV